MGLGPVVLGGEFEVERGVVLVHEEPVGQSPPLIAVGHDDHVEEWTRYLLGEEHREEAAHAAGDHPILGEQQPDE